MVLTVPFLLSLSLFLAVLSLSRDPGLSLADLRLRFLFLRELNRQLGWMLPMVDLRVSYPMSLGTLFRQATSLLFYDCKVSFLHAVLNASTHRTLDQAPPEIKMDPLESVGGEFVVDTVCVFVCLSACAYVSECVYLGVLLNDSFCLQAFLRHR